MKHPLLPLLALALLPLCAPAQTAPPVNLQTGPVLDLPAGAVPVDALPIDMFPSRPGNVQVLVATRGIDNLYRFVPDATQPSGFFRRSGNPLVSAPLDLVPVPGQRLANRACLLMADGTVDLWYGAGSVMAQSGPPLDLRQGRPGGPADRLLLGPFANGGPGGGVGFDMACWSDGPQPGLYTAAAGPGNFGAGPWLVRGLHFAQPQPRSLTQPGGTLSSASFDPPPGTNTQSATVFLTQPADTSGRTGYWKGVPSSFGWWTRGDWWTPPHGAGPCRGIEAAQLDGRSGLELVVLRRDILVYPMDAGRSFYFTGAPPQRYALLPTPTEVRLADLNGDQRPEMIVLGDDGSLNVFENTSRVPGSTSYFNPLPYVLATGPNPAHLRVADYDGDGDLDVLVPCRGDGTVRLFRNGPRTLGTARAAARAALALWPNPATGTVRVSWDATPGPATAPATLLDALGRPVRTWPAVPAAGATLDVAGLPPGVYALRVAGAGTQRLVLE